jgi:hypothetical protein
MSAEDHSASSARSSSAQRPGLALCPFWQSDLPLAFLDYRLVLKLGTFNGRSVRWILGDFKRIQVSFPLL